MLAKTTEENWIHPVDFPQVGLCRIIVMYSKSTDPFRTTNQNTGNLSVPPPTNYIFYFYCIFG